MRSLYLASFTECHVARIHSFFGSYQQSTPVDDWRILYHMDMLPLPTRSSDGHLHSSCILATKNAASVNILCRHVLASPLA